jgi:hypothetical protein
MSTTPKKTIAEQALEQLPENELNVRATTDDGSTVDTTVSIQKTTKRGVGIGVFAKAKLGAGKPKDAVAGVEVKKKW